MPNMKTFKPVVQEKKSFKYVCYITNIMSPLGVAISDHRDII